MRFARQDRPPFGFCNVKSKPMACPARRLKRKAPIRRLSNVKLPSAHLSAGRTISFHFICSESQLLHGGREVHSRLITSS